MSGPVAAIGDFLMPLARLVLVFDPLGLAGDALALGSGRRRGMRCGVRGEGFAEDVADLVGPAAIMLHDFVDNLSHGGPRRICRNRLSLSADTGKQQVLPSFAAC